MKRYSQNDIQDLAEILNHDEVISVPTDTVYGVCARMQKKAEDRLREVKNRPLTKAFPLMCSDIEQVKTIAIIDERAQKVMEAFMPGPLTVILNKREDLEEYVNGGGMTLAIRLATSDALRKLIETVGMPLFMTSANQSGMPTCTSLDEIETQCPLLAGMMEGDVSFGEASTIVDLSKDEVSILRKGPIGLDEILKVSARS